MYQDGTQKVVAGIFGLLLFALNFFVPSLSWAKSDKPKKKSIPGCHNQVGSVKRQPTSINFTALIDKSERRRSKLERRIKIKTSTWAERRGEPARKNHFQFQDISVTWNQSGTKPSFSTVVSDRRDIKAIMGEATLRVMPKNH